MSSAGDQLILEALRKSTLSHLSDAEWGMLTSEVNRVGGIVNLEGYARDAIAEAIQKAKSFGGDRSAAGRYAANMRWMKYKFYEDEGASAAAAAPAPPPPPPPNKGRWAAEQRWKKKKQQDATLNEIAQRRKEWQKILRDAPADSQEAYNAKGVLERLDRAEAQAKAGQGKSETSASAGGADSPDERTARAIASPDLGGLARAIRRDLKAQGKKVPFGAEPYLDALESLGSIKEKYYEDSGKSVVAYLLSNLGTYKGANAKAIKAELKRRLKEGDPAPKSESSEEGLFPAFPPPRKTTGYEDLEVQVPKYRASESRRRAKEKQKKNLPTSETSEERKPRRYAEGDAKTRAMAINSLTRESKRLKREVQRAERGGETGKKVSELKAMYADTVRMLEQEKKSDAMARREGR